MKNLNKYLEILNLPKHMASHVFGENHTAHHRKIAGAVLLAAGTLFVHSGQLLHMPVVNYLFEIFGVGIQAAGAHPYLPGTNKI